MTVTADCLPPIHVSLLLSQQKLDFLEVAIPQLKHWPPRPTCSTRQTLLFTVCQKSLGFQEKLQKGVDYGQVAFALCSLPVWKEDATLEVQQRLPLMWMNQRYERWQSRVAMSLCPQFHLLSHHTNQESLTSRPIIIWGGREAGCRGREGALLA